MNKHNPWMKVHVNPFTDYDAFHCMEPDKEACDFCPHCGIDERCAISGRFARNSIWFACWWCRCVPKERKNHENCKGVIL